MSPTNRVVWVGYILPAVESIPKRGVQELQVFSTAEKAETWRREWDEMTAAGRLPYGLSRQVHKLEVQ